MQGIDCFTSHIGGASWDEDQTMPGTNGLISQRMWNQTNVVPWNSWQLTINDNFNWLSFSMTEYFLGAVPGQIWWKYPPCCLLKAVDILIGTSSRHAIQPVVTSGLYMVRAWWSGQNLPIYLWIASLIGAASKLLPNGVVVNVVMEVQCGMGCD